jgi:hypothetical protein
VTIGGWRDRRAPSEAEAEAIAGDRVSGDDEEDFGFVGNTEQLVEQM